MKKASLIILFISACTGLIYGQTTDPKTDSTETSKMMRALTYYYHRLNDNSKLSQVDWDFVKSCLDKGADANAKNDKGMTPLHIAAYYGDTMVAHLFLKHGADANAHDSKGYTPLILAAMHGNIDVAMLLIEKGADINLTAKGYSVIMYAVVNNRTDFIKMLVHKGANVKTSKSDLQTPLHFVAKYHNVEIAKLLIKKGADVNAVDEFAGETPLFYAIHGDDFDQFDPAESLKTIKLLIKKGANINIKNKTGESPLMVSLRKSNKIALLLIRKGADLNATDTIGRTALHLAYMYSNATVIAELIRRGADVNAKDKQGLTPVKQTITGKWEHTH